MSRKHSQFINVIDLETTCWEPPEVQGGQVQDIIEIGIAALDRESMLIVASESIMVQPTRSTIGDFCTRLTTIQPEDVSEVNAVPFTEALDDLAERYDAKNRLWVSYGDFDRKMFERQCHDFSLAYPFGPRHLNIKNLLAVLYGWPKEYGMARALETCGIPLEGTHHRGVDDAYNTAKLLVHCIAAFNGGLLPPVYVKTFQDNARKA